MHELSLAEALVARCQELADGRHVSEIWVQCPASFDVADLAECFTFLVDGPAEAEQAALAGAKLHVGTVPVRAECPCGFSGELGPDDYAGHMSVCPACGRTGELAGGLDVVAMSFAQPRR